MNSSSLSNQIVLITRPIDQQQGLRDAIEQRSGSVLSFPLIDIAPLEDNAEQELVKSRVQSLDNYQLLIFISTNAAKYGAQWIDKYWPQFPVGVQVMAIGPTTAILVEELLASPSYLPDSGMSSEDLLFLEILQQVEGMKIGIFRGKGGRELLAETLKNRGALVDYLEVYQRQPINYDEGEFCDSLRQTGVTSLTVSSGESLQLLSKLLLSGDNKRDFSLLPLLVPSNRVAQQANDLGFTNVILCKGADSQSMIEALESLETKKVNQ